MAISHDLDVSCGGPREMGESPENIYHANNWTIIWSASLICLAWPGGDFSDNKHSLMSLIYFLTPGRM